MTVILILVAAVVGYVLGSVVGYATGKTDGTAEAADWYERRRRS